MQAVVGHGCVAGALSDVGAGRGVWAQPPSAGSQPAAHPEALEQVAEQAPQQAAGQVPVGGGQRTAQGPQRRAEVLGALCEIPLGQERAVSGRSQGRRGGAGGAAKRGCGQWEAEGYLHACGLWAWPAYVRPMRGRCDARGRGQWEIVNGGREEGRGLWAGLQVPWVRAGWVNLRWGRLRPGGKASLSGRVGVWEEAGGSERADHRAAGGAHPVQVQVRLPAVPPE